MGKNYNEVGVVRQLNKVNGVKISGGKKITIVVSAALGNSTNGKIDFLCNYCGYTRVYSDVAEQKKTKDVEEDVEENDNVVAKHNRKIDIASNVTKIMNSKKAIRK